VDKTRGRNGGPVSKEGRELKRGLAMVKVWERGKRKSGGGLPICLNGQGREANKCVRGPKEKPQEGETSPRKHKGPIGGKLDAN